MYPFDRSTGPQIPGSPRDEAERLLGARKVVRPMLVGGGAEFLFSSVRGYTEEDNPGNALSSGGGYTAYDDAGAHRKHMFFKLNKPLAFNRIRALHFGSITNPYAYFYLAASSYGSLNAYPILEPFDATLTWTAAASLSYGTAVALGFYAFQSPIGTESTIAVGRVFPSGLAGGTTQFYGFKVLWESGAGTCQVKFPGGCGVIAE